MKPKKFIPTCFLISFISILAFNSCKEVSYDEVKVPDFKTLEAQFSQPPKEYTTSPFFVWNADITNEEIDNFLVSFKNAGSSQVFIHPRPGLITEYLSDKWFSFFKHAVEKGKELDMDIWIYDENSYPSGFAGGHVPAEMPESYNQGQGLRMTRFETLPDTCDKYYLCLKEENDNVSSLRSVSGIPSSYKPRVLVCQHFSNIQLYSLLAWYLLRQQSPYRVL